MRVIMDYMYKDHLKAKPFRLLPFTFSPELSAILYLSYAFYYLYPACIQHLQQQPTTKKNKKRNRERRENGIVFLLWIRDYYSIFLISKTAI